MSMAVKYSIHRLNIVYSYSFVIIYRVWSKIDCIVLPNVRKHHPILWVPMLHGLLYDTNLGDFEKFIRQH